MPRYWTGWGISGSFSASSPQDQGAAGGRDRPAEVHRDLGVLHLAAAAGRVVVGVHALRGARAVVVHGPAELAHVLDHHGHPVRVALAEAAAGRVVRPPGSGRDDAARDVLAALALLAEAVLLELEHRRERERVVGARDVHVLGPDAGLAEDDVLRVVARDARDRPVRPLEVEARLGHAPGDAHDVDGPVPAVARALGRGDDQAGRVVGLEAA